MGRMHGLRGRVHAVRRYRYLVTGGQGQKHELVRVVVQLTGRVHARQAEVKSTWVRHRHGWGQAGINDIDGHMSGSE